MSRVAGEIKSIDNDCKGTIEYQFNGITHKIEFIKKSFAPGCDVDDFSVGDKVELKVTEDRGNKGKYLPTNIRKYVDEYYPSDNYDLRDWAFVDYKQIKNLSDLALSESWSFSTETEYYSKDDTIYCEKFPILETYLNYTFKRLCFESKVIISDVDNGYAAFNTGLVNKTYQDIFALFKHNDGGKQPWCLVNFVVSGQDDGKTLTDNFTDLPERANYFTNGISDMVFDLELKDKIDIDYEHILFENISRLPIKFFEGSLPSSSLIVDGKNFSDYQKADRKNYYTGLKENIKADTKGMKVLFWSLQNAVKVAIQRTCWNYKTAVPMYYPTNHSMSMLLPLCLCDENTADVALVIDKKKSGRYQGQTILTLEMAYSNSRLVTRPDSDWLIANVKTSSVEEK